MHRYIRYMSVSFAAALLAACSSPTSADRMVSLATEEGSYTPTETVVFTLTNLSDATMSFGACDYAELQRKVGMSWVHLSEPDGPCIGFLYTLAPGASVTRGYLLPVTVVPGTYRVRFENLRTMDGREVPSAHRVSNSFEIRSIPPQD